MINKLYEIVDTPFFMIVFTLLMTLLGIQLIIKLIKINKKPTYGLYDKANLNLISFGLYEAIDQYEQNYTDEELEKIDHYKELVDLYSYVCKLRGEQ